MLSNIILKVAGLERENDLPYYPRPSLAGPERCIRQLTFWSRNIPRDRNIGDRYQLTIDDSTFHEYLTHDWLQKTSYRLHSAQMQVTCIEYQDFVIKGHIDGVITDILGIDRHYEHKAVNHFAFDRYWNGQYPLDYFTQCALYVRGLKKINPEISQSILLIKNKNTAQYIDFLLEYDCDDDILYVHEIEKSTGEKKTFPIPESFPNIVLNASTRFFQVDTHTRCNTLPERPYMYGTNFPCGYCSWEETCWKDYENEIVLHNDVTLDTETEIIAREYQTISESMKTSEKRKDELRNELLLFLNRNKTNTAIGDNLKISKRFQEYMSLDKDRIPIEILNLVRKVSIKEILTVREVKPKKSG